MDSGHILRKDRINQGWLLIKKSCQPCTQKVKLSNITETTKRLNENRK